MNKYIYRWIAVRSILSQNSNISLYFHSPILSQNLLAFVFLSSLAGNIVRFFLSCTNTVYQYPLTDIPPQCYMVILEGFVFTSIWKLRSSLEHRQLIYEERLGLHFLVFFFNFTSWVSSVLENMLQSDDELGTWTAV